jgi:hypothetical protein
VPVHAALVFYMLRSSVTFAYGGRCYTFAQDLEKVIKGKLACDCTKSQLIRDYCDPTFPALRCGENIEIVSLVDVVIEPAIRKPEACAT